MSTVTIVVDYPDDLIEQFGITDAEETFRARLTEVYPGTDGNPHVPNIVSVTVT